MFLCVIAWQARHISSGFSPRLGPFYLPGTLTGTEHQLIISVIDMYGEPATVHTKIQVNKMAITMEEYKRVILK